MAATNAAAVHMASAVTGGGVTAFNNANAYIGVGDSTTAFSAAHTDLQASTNKLRKGMQPTYPQLASNVVTFQALFIESEANFAWQEFAVFNASSGGTMISRKVQSLGTKPGTEQWRITVTSTFGVA